MGQDKQIRFNCDEGAIHDFDRVADKHDLSRSQMLRRAIKMIVRADNQGRLNSMDIDFEEVSRNAGRQ